jgi:hypothetical protein
MSESDPSGYHDSPDTSDGAVTPGAEQTGAEQTDAEQTGAPEDERPEADATLTTDDDAQRDGSVERPGNEPD